jgi:nucleotide-binding universal stress UspA family protein
VSQERDGSGYRVVAAVDGSACSVDVLCWAARRAEFAGGSVDAVMAWQYPADLTGYAWGPASTIEDVDYGQTAEQVVADTIGQAVGRGSAAPVRPVVTQGHPADVLIGAADGADLLVVGSHGRGGLTGALLGSVSRYCIQHARCPVAVIRGAGDR